MDAALVLSALLMGLAGSPHCVAMCGAACTALAGRCGAGRPQQALLGFHLGRLLGYSAAGAIAAGSVSLLAQFSQLTPALRPLWTLVHVAALGLGVWLLVKGKQPEWIENLGRGTRLAPAAASAAGAGGWQPMLGPLKAGLAGTAWVAWPCGLLQSALVVAALGHQAASGALIMAGFALGSSLGLWLGPALWWRLGAPGSRWLASGGWAVRLAGLGLAGASAWALGHGLWQRIADWCAS
jgi:Uncharacterized conserved protein|nr:sulfite exporter TauE/SafE family protein [uncultured Azohydromonas sp.]